MKAAILVFLFSLPVLAQTNTHNFFDKTSKFSLISTAAVFAADAATTCHGLGKDHVEDWLPVKSCPTISLWMAGDSGAQIGGSYLLHRLHHHKIERMIEFLSATGSIVAMSYTTKYRH